MQPFSHPSYATHKIWSRLANWLQRYSSLKVWTTTTTDDGRRTTTDGPLVYYKLTLWAFGSGELTRWRGCRLFYLLFCMLVNPITGVLNGCRHRKGTELMLKKFLCIQNQEKHIVLVKQYKTKILILVFDLKLSLDAIKPLPKGQNLTLTGAIVKFSSHLISSLLSPLTSEVVGAPQMTLQQYLPPLPGFPLLSGNLQTPFPSIPWWYRPISSSVFISVLLFSLSPADLSSPCPRIWVPFSLPWLVDHHALQLHSGLCCEPPHSSHGLCRKYSELSNSISSQGLGSFSRFLPSRSSSHKHKGRSLRWASASA